MTAVFDPTAAKIPLPNDLVFASAINSVCPAPANAATAPSDPPMCAQAELLRTFNPSGQFLAGKFPSDQEVPLTIDFTENTFVNGRLKLVAPDLDLATITSATLGVVGAAGPVELEMPPTAADYVKGDDHGTLTVHRKNHLPWAPGGYTLVLRGGAMGVKTVATADAPAIPVTPSPVFDLIEQGKDMTLPENLGLLKAQSHGSTADALAQGAQLNGLIQIYKASAFPVADAMFGAHTEMAIASTFQIDKAVTNVTVDPARGLAPLPFDILRDATTGKLTPVAACSLAGGTLDKDGKCSQPGAAGFEALDGFSTTGAILAPTSAPINITTVTSQTLKLFDLTDPKNPVEVTSDPPTGALIAEPCEFSAQFVAQPAPHCDTSLPPAAPVIAFQPAGATSGDRTSVFRTQPLKDNTDYAVVMTTGIKDMAGNSIGPGTVAKVLRFTNALFVGGHSALQGIDDGTAASLEKMRKQLPPVFAKLGADAANVAMAYTFHTQTVLSQAVGLAAFPYTQPSTTALPKGTLSAVAADVAFAKYGVPLSVPHDKIGEILEVDMQTFNAIDPATGAFLPPDQNNQIKQVAETIHVLIATPLAAAAPPCKGDLAPFGKCAPLMVFRHGLGRGRADMLLIANSFAAAGMVTVAIDAAKHGDRTLCSTNPDPADSKGTGCVGTCVPLAMSEGQGDPATPGKPGTCDAQGLTKDPVVPGVTGNTDGIATRSSNYLITANFFRTRDTLRQDLIDESQLVRVMAFAPSDPTKLPPNSGHLVIDHMVQSGSGVIIDPATVFYTGQSLGAIQGTANVATNPRISRAGLNVGGGTLVDIFSTSPAFAAGFQQLLQGLKINPATQPDKFLQFLTVGKTVLDPADPVNFAGHLTASTLPNLLTPLGGNSNGTVPQLPKKVLMQVANCDDVVPNPFSLVWASNLAFATARATPPALPQGPLPNDPAFSMPGTTGQFQLFAGKAFPSAPTECNADTAVEHSFLLGSVHQDLTIAAQSSLVSFMTSTAATPAVPSLILAQ